MAAMREFHRFLILGAIILPGKPEERHAGRNKDHSGQIHNEQEQSVDHVAVIVDVLRQPVPIKRADLGDRKDEGEYTQDGDHQKQQTPKASHNYSPFKSIRKAHPTNLAYLAAS